MALSNRYRAQAKAQAQLRYAPQTRGLRALLAELQANRDSEIAAAHAQRIGTAQAVQTAKPRVLDAFSQNMAGLGAVQRATQPVNAGLGTSAQSILQAALTEGQAAQGRVHTAQRQATVDLEDQRREAAAGEGYAVRAANQRYSADSAKVLQQLIDLSGDQGLYAATTLGDLVDKARGRAVTRRGQTLSHQDRVASLEQRKAEAKRKAAQNGGRGWAPQGAQDKARTTLGAARNEIATLKESGAAPDEVFDLLSKGAKEQRTPIYEDVPDPNRPGKTIRRKKLNEDGTPVERVVPGVEKVKDTLILQAAIEQEYDGYISDRTKRLLHKNRIRIAPLGVTTRGQYVKRRKRTDRGNRTAGPNGQARPN